MQSHSSNESKITIPPNVLKNFKVYDILEPQKNSDATKVEKLVDIDDCSRDSGFQDLSPEFLDKNRDFDLVDLYQNIFVTPQHIKKKEATDDVDTSKVIDPGFKQFCDMLESGQKIDWTKVTQSKKEAITKYDFIEEKPRVLVPKVFTEPDSDPEELINEVLTQKKLERLILGNVSNTSNLSEPQERDSPKKIKKSDVVPEFERLSLINTIINDSKFVSENTENVPRSSKTKTCPEDSQINSSTTFIVQAIQKDEKLYKKKRLLKPEHVKANYTKGPDFYEKSVVLPQIMARLNARLAYMDEKNNQKRRLVLDTGAKPIKTEGSSLNAKEQAKKLNSPSSSDIHSLKLGSVPIRKEAQMCINKLTNNVAVHVTDKPCVNCCKPSTAKKANSPTTASVKTDYGKLSPVVLMEDCNKERLRALKQSQMFKDFVLKGKYDL